MYYVYILPCMFISEKINCICTNNQIQSCTKYTYIVEDIILL